MLLRLVLAGVLVLFFNPIKAQEDIRSNFEPSIAPPSKLLDNQKPEANWIWDSGQDNPRNYYLLVRKTFNLDQIPVKAQAFISAYAFADVYILSLIHI